MSEAKQFEQLDNDSVNHLGNVDIEQVKRILGSCSINFLFGSGVNGSGFPQFTGFEATLAKMKALGLEGRNIENELRGISDEGKRDQILEAFCAEFNKFALAVEFESESIRNLDHLMCSTNSVISKAENRHPESKRVNIFTLNYDRILETILENNGLFHYVLTSHGFRSSLPFEIIGYNTARHEYIPTFAVYKMHGSVGPGNQLHKDQIMFPGSDKLGNVVSDFYETLFAMKGELLRKNSALFVVGYSWGDSHINDAIEDAISNGLTVFQLQYSEDSSVPDNLVDSVIAIPPSTPCQDTTLTLSKIIDETTRS